MGWGGGDWTGRDHTYLRYGEGEAVSSCPCVTVQRSRSRHINLARVLVGGGRRRCMVLSYCWQCVWRGREEAGLLLFRVLRRRGALVYHLSSSCVGM